MGDERFDLCVVGAGITGSAIARDAAMRGLRVVLVDQGDLGGASAPATELLAAGDGGELRRLRALSPHLVQPRRVLTEPDRSARGARAWGQRLRGSLARGANPPPGLPDGLATTACGVNGPRLALSLARSAHDAGAWVLPWLRLEALVAERGRVSGLELFDRLGGDVRVLRASVVVDATGPWLDRTRGLRGTRERMVEPLQRIALAVAGEHLAPGQAVRLASGTTVQGLHGRTVALDAGRPYHGDFDHLMVSPERCARLRGEIEGLWPGGAAAKVLGAWTGLAAQPAARGGQARLAIAEDGLISVLGGSADDHRRLAEEALIAVAAQLRADGVHVGGCLTAAVPLPGGEGVLWRRDRLEATGPGAAEARLHAEEDLPPGCAAQLLATYGGRWHEVAAAAVDDPDLATALAPGLPIVAAQVRWALEEECVCSLPDLLRRLDLPLLDLRAASGLLAPLAQAAAAAQGWSAADVTRQVAFAGSWLESLAGALPADS